MPGSLPRGIVECHHIPDWHSCLYIAELQALARAACREEASTGSQGLSPHLLPEPVREPAFITSTDAKSSSCHSGDIVPWLRHSRRFPSQVCMFVQWSHFPPLFLYNPSNLFILTDHFSEGKTPGNRIPFLASALSPICHITLLRQHLQASRGRFNHAASVLWLPF